MATSRDPEELKHIWKSWHDVCGKAIVPDFPRYVEILTEAAKLLNISDYTVAWLRDYESEKFTEEIGKTSSVSFNLFFFFNDDFNGQFYF